NGMMMGEAIVSFNKEISKNFKYIRKQGMQLISKMRFISVQFIPYLENEIWRENATNSNNMAKYLKEELLKIQNVKMINEVSGNILFAQFPKELKEVFKKEFSSYEMDRENNILRLVTSFDTTKEDVDDFVKRIKIIIEGGI